MALNSFCADFKGGHNNTSKPKNNFNNNYNRNNDNKNSNHHNYRNSHNPHNSNNPHHSNNLHHSNNPRNSNNNKNNKYQHCNFYRFVIQQQQPIQTTKKRKFNETTEYNDEHDDECQVIVIKKRKLNNPSFMENITINCKPEANLNTNLRNVLNHISHTIQNTNNVNILNNTQNDSEFDDDNDVFVEMETDKQIQNKANTKISKAKLPLIPKKEWKDRMKSLLPSVIVADLNIMASKKTIKLTKTPKLEATNRRNELDCSSLVNVNDKLCKVCHRIFDSKRELLRDTRSHCFEFIGLRRDGIPHKHKVIRSTKGDWVPIMDETDKSKVVGIQCIINSCNYKVAVKHGKVTSARSTYKTHKRKKHRKEKDKSK